MAGRVVVPLSQPATAVTPPHTHLLPPKPKKSHNLSSNNNIIQHLPSVPSSSRPPSSAPRSGLNPLANNFIPFALLLPMYDDLDKNMDCDDMDFDSWDPCVDNRVDDILTQEAFFQFQELRRQC